MSDSAYSTALSDHGTGHGANVSTVPAALTAGDVLHAVDVSALLGIPVSTVHEWARAGALPSRKRGRHRLGGFTRSSQHLDVRSGDGQASGVDEGVDGPLGDEVAGQAVASARGRAVVLA